MHVVQKPPPNPDKEKAKYYKYHKSKTHDTGECTVLKKEVDENKFTGDLSEVAKHLRSKFEADHREFQAWKDTENHPTTKEEIFTIVGPHEGSECQEIDGNIEVLPKNILSIIFSSKDL